jgi:hypothetical protein
MGFTRSQIGTTFSSVFMAFTSANTVVHGGGHMLGKEYVGPLLDRWLPPVPENEDMTGTDHLE